MFSSPRRGLAAIIAGVAILAVFPALAGGAYLGSHDRPGQATKRTSVTLITGDVVTVTERGDGRTVATIEDGPGSSGGVQTQTVGRETYVIPDEALPYLAADRLDRELFNVSELVEQGYTAELPLIAEYAGTVRTRAARTAPAGADKMRDLASINAAAIATDMDEADRFWDAVTAPTLAARFTGGITKIWLDGKVEIDLADSVPQVGAPEAWAAGYDGTGAKVAVLDTGVDGTHPDLADRIRDAVSFVPGEDTVDRNGHGTHVASTIAGSGSASGGVNKGVAPGADLFVGKVLDESGQGQNSWVIDAMEWAAQAQDADVVNMSLGDPAPSDGTDPMSQALNQLTEDTGTLFVVAAGNGWSEFAVGSPGVADAALTVAAVDGLDQRAEFSSMGPRVGDHALKPDLSAPGVDVLAARSQAMPWGEGMYQPMDGTSMATPHVAGAAAILAARRPDWAARRLKDALMSSSKALTGTTPYEVGTGRLDIPASLGEVHATGSAYLGFFSWPHDGDAPATKTITYTNAGDMPVTLSLRDEITAPGGQEFPELVALSGDEVTVPAGGSAEVTVAADADDAAGVGRYTGFVVATDASGAVRARTAVGLVKEDERYTLNIRALGRDGEPAGGYVTFYEYGTDFVYELPIDPDTGRVAPQRLKPGIYNVTTWLDVAGNGGPDSAGVALLGEPHLVVDSDEDIVLDARKAKPVTVKTPRPSEDRYRRVQYHHNTGIGGIFEAFTNTQIVQPDVDDIFVAPTGVVPGKAFDFAVRWRRSEPLLDLSAHLPRRTALDPIYQGGSVRLDGKVLLRGVYAGTGTAAEYEGLNARGRAVLISRSDAVQPWDWAPVAAEAGAALLVVVNDRPGKLYEFAGGGGTDLPVVSLTKAQGDPLIAAARAGRLVLHGDAVEFSEYMYDLTRSNNRRIPAGLSYAPRTRDLARIDQRFIGGTPRLAFEGRYDCRPYQWPLCLGSYEPVQTGSTRADYVSTQAGTKWYQDVFHSEGWEQRHDQVTYKAGRRTSFDWFAPVTRPRLGPGYWGPDRSDDFMAVNVPTSSGSDNVTGSMWEPAGTVTSRLYHDGVLLAESPYQAAVATVPTGAPAQYRFEQDTERASDPWKTSIRTRSAWTFTSARPEEGTVVHLPLLQLDYAVDTDLKGDVEVGETDVLGISAAHVPGVVGGGRVLGATLELSYDDGFTWQRVALERAHGGGWHADVRYPRRGADFVSLKATAWDDAGNRVEQEIIRAYGLD